MNHLPLQPNHERRLVYWPVRKLGTTYASGRLHKAGFTERLSQIDQAIALDTYEHFGLVREPRARYVSALAQMWRSDRVGDVEWVPWIEGIARYNRRRPEPWTAGRDPHFEPFARFYAQAPNMRLWRIEDIDEMLAWAGWDGAPNPPQNATDLHLIDQAWKILDVEPIDAFYADDIALTANLYT